MTLVITVIVGLLAALLGRHLIRRLKRRGPIGLPILGSLPYMMYRAVTDRQFRWYLFVDEMRKAYGEVISLVIGTQEFVVISGYNKIKAAFVDRADVFSQRPNHPFYQIVAEGRGLLFSEGPLWQDQRRFALRVLRDFGLGRSLSEQQIQTEAQELARHLSDYNGQETDVKSHITKAVVNVIAGLVFAQRSGYEDPKLEEFLEHTKALTQAGLDTVLMVFFPQLPISLTSLSPSSNRILQSERWVMDYCWDKIQDISRNYDKSSEPICFVEAYLREQRMRQASGEGDVGSFDNRQLIRTVSDLYVAGSDTTATTLRWALLYCCFHPELQEACHIEISTVIGDREVSMKDKRSLHKVQAFLDETQRMANLVPMSVEHRAAKHSTAQSVLSSYGPGAIPGAARVQHPNRFLDLETGTYKPSEYLIPFSVGKRSCLGETLARMELFLFFVTLLQKFRFEPNEDCKLKREDILLGHDGIVRAPADHRLVVHSRAQ
uniref:Cytochrome P450 n=1 Tax=Macrostomum lignano TaxID=282301 RepID=A0A1I8FYX5_9PLAT